MRWVKDSILQLRAFFFKLLLQFKSFKTEESILIFSEARGGSTWLMEMLNQALDTAICWEPLHVNNGLIPDRFRLGWRPFLKTDKKNNELNTLFEKILSYKVSNKWSGRYLNIRSILSGEYVLVKFVRANLLLPYFLKIFRFKHQPILLIRHPVDTCVSQIKAFDFDYDTYVKRNKDVLNNERHLANFEYISKLESKLEQKIAIWCINNCPLLNNIEEIDNVFKIYYHELLLDPESVLTEYFTQNKFLKGIEHLNKIEYRKASKTDFNKELGTDVNKQLNKNLKMLNVDEKEKIQAIFDYFDFKLFNAFEAYPTKMH